MKQILSIAKLTLRAAFRFKVVALLGVFLVAAVTALPLLIKDDGTARGFVQILLTYSLGLTVTTLGLATLWLSCGTLARDIEECRIQMIVVKPIARWKIWLGKWVGVMLVNLLLMGTAGMVIYGLLEYRGSKLTEKQRFVLENEVFVARGSAREAPIDLTKDVEDIYQERLSQSSASEQMDKVELKKQISEMLKHQYQLVPEGMMRVWSIPLGLDAAGVKDKPLYVRAKFIAMSHNSTFDDTRTFPMLWEMGPIDTPQSWRTVVMMTPNVAQEIQIPPNLLDENGVLHVRFMNDQNDTFFFDMNEGLEVLYRQGGFFLNYLKGLAILFCWLALLAAIGLSASSFLSFPVASFFAISVLILGLSTGTMTQVIEEGGISGANHETGRIEEKKMIDNVSVVVFKGLKNVTELVLNFSPVELLSQGRTVTWKMIFNAVLQIVFLVGGIFGALGIYCFSKRELALAKGGQGESMNSRFVKFMMSLLIGICLVACHFLQRTINQERKEMGLTRLEVLENAPPILAFTTVALGGFRGLIVNVLWTRMTDLGDQNRYFETIQLADWITKLEPTFAAVWNWQAWNLAYNISIKFSDPRQRWHWVYSGVKLLRDEGIPYNSNRPDLYRELAWFYQNKIGYYLDDCHLYYKAFWADEMEAVLGKEINWETLLNPQTDEEKEKVRKLQEEYKLDPHFMKKVDDKYGPFEWRMPDAHAIYWAMLGLERCKDNKKDDLMPLRRAIYQPMLLNFHRGRLVENRFSKTMEYRPNLDAIANTDRAYQEFAAADPEYHDHILKAHKNFLKDAIYFLYSYNRISESAKYYREFAQMYPTQTLLSGDPTSTPGNIALDEFVLERVEEDVRDNSPDRVRGIIEGLLFSSFYALSLDQEEEATGNAGMALKVWEKYDASIVEGDEALRDRMGLPSFQSMRTEALRQFLLVADERDPLMGDALRVRLNLPARDTSAPKPAETPAPSEGSATNTSTNAPAVPAP